MEEEDSFQIMAEQPLPDHKVQLVKDRAGCYHLRKVSVKDGTIFSSVPVHRDLRVIAEARELFPDLLPFGGLPVDAT